MLIYGIFTFFNLLGFHFMNGMEFFCLLSVATLMYARSYPLHLVMFKFEQETSDAFMRLQLIAEVFAFKFSRRESLNKIDKDLFATLIAPVKEIYFAVVNAISQ